MDTATATATACDTSVPLCVDLDGTLIKTDLLWESLVRLLRRNPLWAFVAPFWWMRGRAFLKHQIAARVTLDPSSLPFNAQFVEYLRAEKRAGRKLILATASDGDLAKPVAHHLGVFDDTVGSDGRSNLRGENKLRLLTERFGERGFDYAGNSSVDLAVWPGARQAIVVNASKGLAQRAAACTKLGPTFPRSNSALLALIQTLRPHQWVKNLIVFVPVITSHSLTFWPLLSALGAFVTLCLCASGVYVLNDLMDLDADRQHPTKRERPFAAGELPLQVGLFLFPTLLVLSGAIAWWMTSEFAMLLAIYVIATTAYSWQLKRVALLDVFILAGLYTLRLIAGHIVTDIAYSVWLLVFSMFIFLSLALMKRFRELQDLRKQNMVDARGRGYTASDLELVTMLGLINGSLAVLVLALYVNSEQVVTLYQHPILLLLICPLLLFWVSRIWLLAHRGQMHTDPVVFVLKDWVSYAVGLLTLLVVWLATGH
jgi:4-hydroxybenzoate polyprenyltransferase/phosphoserine phosphatase